RTLSTRYPTYNPMSYHNGSVWPHDNSLIAQGFARYGLREEAAEIASALIEAGRRFPSNRLPELWCGFQRDLRFSSRPADYLVSCIPQAWSAGMVFLCLRALLGMQPDLNTQRLLLDPAGARARSRLPERDGAPRLPAARPGRAKQRARPSRRAARAQAPTDLRACGARRRAQRSDDELQPRADGGDRMARERAPRAR